MDELQTRFKALEAYVEKREERAKAGYVFEQFLYDLFRAAGLEARLPTAREIDQIDGAVRLDGTWYLVEAKWRVGRSDVQSLDHFHQSVTRSSTGGFFFAYAGFTSNAIAAAGVFSPKSIILADGEDLRAVVEGRIEADKLLRLKVEAARVDGKVYVHPAEMASTKGTPGAMVLAAIGRQLLPGSAIGPALIYDPANLPARDQGLSNRIIIATLASMSKNEAFEFEMLIPFSKAAIVDIGGGLDHFSLRVRGRMNSLSENPPAMVAGLFENLVAGPDASSVILGGKIVRNGDVLAVDAGKGAIYLPGNESDVKDARKILEHEASRVPFTDSGGTSK